MSSTRIGESRRAASPLTILLDFARQLQIVNETAGTVHLSLSDQASELFMAQKMAERAQTNFRTLPAVAQDGLMAIVHAMSNLDLLMKCQVAALRAISGEIHTLAQEARNVSYTLVAAIGGGEALRGQLGLLTASGTGNVVSLRGHNSDDHLADRVSRRVSEMRERLDSVQLNLEREKATQQETRDLIESVGSRLAPHQPSVELELLEI